MTAHILAIAINKFMNDHCARTTEGNDAQWIDNIETSIINRETRGLVQAIESGVRRHPEAAEEANRLLTELRQCYQR